MPGEIEILQIIHMLGYAYPNARIAEDTLKVYLSLLNDLPADQLRTAACEHIARSNFFPSVAELREGVFRLRAHNSPIPDAHTAWAEVQAEIQRVGGRGKPAFSHKLIADLVVVFGWRSLCLSENAVADRSQFVQAYQARLAREVVLSRMLPQTRELLIREYTLALPVGVENAQ